MYISNYKEIVLNLKSTILQSRYIAARLANKELLNLYFQIGRIITDQIKKSDWGTKIIETISNDLQNELPGLRGFSTGNLKKMRVFYNEWKKYFQIGSALPNQIYADASTLQIGSALPSQFIEWFYSLGFTHHYLILSKTKDFQERVFYITLTAQNFLTSRALEQNLKENLYKQQGKLLNNFEQTLPENISNKAVRMFKDEYLFDYINIEEEDDERVFEKAIMQNI